MEQKISKDGHGVYLTIQIPFKESTDCMRISKQPHWYIIKKHMDSIRNAVVLRMQSCYEKLASNAQNVLYNDGHQILYKDATTGILESFNLPSYNVMESVVKAIDQKEFERWTLPMLEQTLKALTLDNPRQIEFDGINEVIRYLINSIATFSHLKSNGTL